MNLKKLIKLKKRVMKKGGVSPTLYDEHNNPLIPPFGSRYSKKVRHKLQYPSTFTVEETKEILEKQSIKDKEL